MRICIATYDLTRTIGQGRINYELAYDLARRGHEVVLVSVSLTSPASGGRRGDVAADHDPHVGPWGPGALPGVRGRVASRHSERAIRYPTTLNGFTSYLPADVNVSMFVHAHWMRSPFYQPVRSGRIYALYHRAFSALNAAYERSAYRGAVPWWRSLPSSATAW